MFKFSSSDETSKIGNTAQAAVNTAGQTVQHVLDQVTETGQKVIDDTCKTAQDTGEKAVRNVTGKITSCFGKSEEKKEEEKKTVPT